MQERAIHISSVNIQKIGKNNAEDFIIKFEPPLKLDPNMHHELAMDRVSMTYSIILMRNTIIIKSNTVQMEERIGEQLILLMECIHTRI